MSARIQDAAIPEDVLAKSLTNTAKILGIRQMELSEIVGKDRTSIARGLDPKSKPGELALLLIRIYRSLSVMVGGDEANMRHWFETNNLHLGAIPKEKIKTIQGLVDTTQYLDAIRGKI